MERTTPPPPPDFGPRRVDETLDLALHDDGPEAPEVAAPRGGGEGLLYEPPESRTNIPSAYEAPDLAVPQARGPVRRSRWPWLLLLLLPLGAALGVWLKPLPPLVGVNTATLSFGSIRLGAVETRSIQVENRGERRLTLVGATLEADTTDEDEFSFTQDGCADQVLEPAATCSVTVAFNPRERGLQQALVWIASDAPNGPVGVSLVGQGIAPQVVLEPARLSFTGLPVGASGGAHSVRVRNDGTSPLVVTAVELEGLAASDFRVANDGCTDQTLARGEDCRVRVDFSPRDEGERKASLWLRSDEPGGALSVPIVGRGLAQEPLLSVDATDLDLGAVAVGDATQPVSVSLINDGSGPLTVSSVALGETDGDLGSFTLDADACLERPIAPGDRCAVAVVYTATRSGAAANSLVVAHSADDVATTIPVRAMGLAPGLRMVPLRLAFGEVPLSQPSTPQSVTFENTGMAPLALSGLRLDGADASSFMLDAGTCVDRRLEPGDQCRASLRLRPRREGAQRAELVVRHNAVGGEERISITGEGLAPRLELDTTRLDYGGLTIGSRRDLSVSLSNTGRAPLRLTRVSLGGSNRTAFGLVSNRCADATLAPGDRCTVSIRFEPDTEGAVRGELVVTVRDLDTRRTVPLTGIGLPRPVPKARIEPGGFDFGPYDIGRRSEIATVTVRNAGTGPLTVGDFRISGADADAFEVVIGSCTRGSTVPAGGNCTIGIRYLPRRAGAADAALVIRHDAGTGRDEVLLKGQGLDPAPSVPGPGR